MHFSSFAQSILPYCSLFRSSHSQGDLQPFAAAGNLP